MTNLSQTAPGNSNYVTYYPDWEGRAGQERPDRSEGGWGGSAGGLRREVAALPALGVGDVGVGAEEDVAADRPEPGEGAEAETDDVRGDVVGDRVGEAEELLDARADFAVGRFDVDVEPGVFRLREYEAMLAREAG